MSARPVDDAGANSATAADLLVDRLLSEMKEMAQSSQPVRAEALLAEHAWLAEHPQAAMRLVIEEICLAQDRGEKPNGEDVLRRFPQWAEQLSVMLELGSVLIEDGAPARLPDAGDVLNDYFIVAELGRGGHGRVFLARQTSLADRPVVLKVTTCEGEEHLSLARLQHTHIAPLYSAEDLTERNLRILCMPFLGVLTLGRALVQLATTPPPARSGATLCRLLDDANASSAVALTSQGPERERLARRTYVQTVSWLAACVADALHYAHERGLVHMDLKPSNILLTADGQPVVLDFHLARPPITAAARDVEWLGGTPGHMSPEHAVAVDALAAGHPVPAAIDGRSDQYELGLVLYDLLGGVRGPDRPPEPQHLPEVNPQVTVGLADIVARCLKTDPNERYPAAATLADDLRRHLDDRPLAGVPNRSLRERWQKWRRRRPHSLALVAGVLLSLVAVMATQVYATRRYVEHWRNAANALQMGQTLLARDDFDKAAEAFEQGKDDATGLISGAVLAQSLELHLQGARRGQDAQKLHNFAEQLRFHAVLEPLPPRTRVFVDGSRLTWEKRESLLRRDVFPLPERIERTVRTDLLDVALLLAELQVCLALPDDKAAAHRDAKTLLADAEAKLGPSAVLLRHRAAHARALGDPDSADQLEVESGANPPETAWDHYALGRYWLFRGDWAAAAAPLDTALRMAPLDFLPHFYRGICADRQRDYPRAIAEFTFCVGQSADAWTFFYRGRSRRLAGDLEAARQDFELALKVDLGQGTVRAPPQGTGGPGSAIAERRPPPAEVYYQLALVQLAQHDSAAARRSVENALTHAKDHAGALELRERLSEHAP